ncbi:P-loop containing nucleoside triphosphate hydrolase protein, partial [Ilyonectria destructans]
MSTSNSTSFGDWNHGVQVAQNYAPINAEIHVPLEPTPQPFASIPFRRDRAFVDRGDILNQIDSRCSESAGRVALVGLGGMGKSQLAIEFAYRIAETSADTWVFWVHATTPARIVEGFKTIADNVKLQGRNQPKADILQLVYNWLSKEQHGKWLMILDSADDYHVLFGANENSNNRRPLADYLPQSRNGSIVLTTRNKSLAFRLAGDYSDILDIGPMTQKEALVLLENRVDSLSDVNIAAILVRVLDLIPLAISQAAAYIRKNAPRSSVQQYLDEFRKSEEKRARLLGHKAGDLRRDLRQDGGASNAILTTWLVTFDRIRSERPSAADLLSLMSFFNRQGIPESLLKPPKNTRDVVQLSGPEEMIDSESDSSSGCDADSDFEDDLETLRDYCMITLADMESNKENTFEMHGLVQLSTRRWLKANKRQEHFQNQYITLMADSFPTRDYRNWTTCRTLFAHVEVAIEYRLKENSLKKKWADLLHNGGWYALLQGSYAIAEQMARKAKDTREEILGNENVETLASLSLFARVLSSKGSYADAEKLLVQVMETHKTKLGADHPDTLTSMANLASIYRNQGRWEEAEKLEVQVMETFKMKLGTDYPSTLTSMANLALIFWNQGRWEEAENLFVQVIETFKTKLGADHPSTLTSMANLASTYRNQGRWEE